MGTEFIPGEHPQNISPADKASSRIARLEEERANTRRLAVILMGAVHQAGGSAGVTPLEAAVAFNTGDSRGTDLN